MRPHEQPMPKITFHNEPKLSTDAVDAKFNERRLSLIPRVEEYLTTQERFKDQEVGITFAHSGISSLVTFIETPAEKLVLKVALSKGYSNGEAQFLKTWEQVGVKVPHVFDSGEIDGGPYTLMEYIDEPLVSDAYNHEQKIDQGIYVEMGQILRTMHGPEGEGYGRVVEGKGEFKTFEEWLYGLDIEERVEYVKEHDLLTDDHGSQTAAFEALLEHTAKENKSSYCHDDFGGNIFATKPLTVFDPNPRFNNGYIDLGRTLANHVAHGIFPKQMIEGYFGDESYNEKALHAAVYINTLMKLPYSHKKGRAEAIQKWQKYLAENRNLLDG